MIQVAATCMCLLFGGMLVFACADRAEPAWRRDRVLSVVLWVGCALAFVGTLAAVAAVWSGGLR